MKTIQHNPYESMRRGVRGGAILCALLFALNATSCTVFAFLQEDDNPYGKDTSLLIAAAFLALKPDKATSASSRIPIYLYVSNETGSSVSEYTIDSSTGSLTSGATTATTGAPLDVAASYSSKFAYTGNSAGSVDSYSIGGGGTLTSTGTDFSLSDGRAVTVHPNESHVYVADDSGGAIHHYSVDSSTGVLTWVATISPGSQPYDVAVTPDGNYLYAPLFAGSAVAMYSIDSSGGLTSLGTIAAGSQTNSLAIDPGGRYVYATSNGAGQVFQYTIQSDGTLAANGSFGVGTVPTGVAVDDGGRYAYVVDSGSTVVHQYSINSDGTLASLGTINTGGATPKYIVATTTSVYVADDGTNDVREFTIGSSGSLSAVATYATGANPSGLAIGYMPE